MSNTNMLKYMLIVIGALFAVIVIVYLILNKKMQKSEYQQIKNAIFKSIYIKIKKKA